MCLFLFLCIYDRITLNSSDFLLKEYMIEEFLVKLIQFVLRPAGGLGQIGMEAYIFFLVIAGHYDTQ